MLCTNFLLLLLLIVKLSEDVSIDLVEVVLLLRIVTLEAGLSEERPELRRCEVVEILFLSFLWIFSLQYLLSMAVIPCSLVWV